MLKGVREVGGAGAANCARVRLQPHDARKGETPTVGPTRKRLQRERSAAVPTDTRAPPAATRKCACARGTDGLDPLVGERRSESVGCARWKALVGRNGCLRPM
jgi:hypothetical protein